ncbi:haloacid dehalogenase type II [Novosphingobium album (ex Hu et al. 2023)]|uniref:Haloacid dehalogenase type II n=1 Tax=Novosphingobium album (ex Hu et al. 2023) TaxID=2930093 RepID=A0ABT0B7W3_9SPHN|nr:haloacid dehalogenase type II [Novosphingobium album (ex Hu et al. 2023)]MCJ2180914.1 haloacid dehalogenase type II [Novosphingobium album (ex Hu et al. 2023)]
MTSTLYTPPFRPKYISFDCYGTLINFRMADVSRAFFADRIPAERMDEMVKLFSMYRFDEILGDWKPYRDVLHGAIRRTSAAMGVEFREADVDTTYAAVPTWGPHADVPGGLSKIGGKIPLVILSNAMNEQIQSNVDQLGAPFHRVYTAESAGAYKPRMRAFEFMFDMLGCGPEDMMHVSSSFRYDQNTATDLGFGCRVFVGRGHEPSNAFYRDVEIPHIGCLPAVVGL